MKGNIFSLEEFSVYDGPGIRTSVFLKGCPLRCTWCHNPEGQLFESEIVKSPNGCVSCGSCIRYLSEVNGRAVLSEESIKHCPMNLIRRCGEEISAEELCGKILKNERILKNGGGVTFSGGEPLSQSEFVFECIDILRGRLHTAIQTSGYCKKEVFELALKKADHFLYDLKIINEDKHKKFTGVSNKLILENFKALAKSGKDCVIRTPLIPEVTDTEENITDIATVLKENGINYIEVLPYNKMAGAKYKMVMREFTPGFDERIEVNPHTEIFKDFGINVKIM